MLWSIGKDSTVLLRFVRESDLAALRGKLGRVLVSHALRQTALQSFTTCTRACADALAGAGVFEVIAEDLSAVATALEQAGRTRSQARRSEQVPAMVLTN